MNNPPGSGLGFIRNDGGGEATTMIRTGLSSEGFAKRKNNSSEYKAE